MKTISKYFFALIFFTTSMHCAEETNPSNFDHRHFANLIYEGNTAQVEQLLKAGYNPNQEYRDDPMLWRAIVDPRHNTSTEMTQLLLQYKADPNGKTACQTLLAYACEKSSLTIVNLLLDARANINAKSPQGRTAIRDAAWSNHIVSASCFNRLLDEPTIELNLPESECGKYNAFCVLATNRELNSTHLPVLARMLALGADPNVIGVIDSYGSQTIFKRYCSHQWMNPEYPDLTQDPRVTKAVLLACDAHRNNVKKEQKAIRNAVLKATSLAPDATFIVAQYACPLIAPDNKELDKALEKYRNIEPIEITESVETA